MHGELYSPSLSADEGQQAGCAALKEVSGLLPRAVEHPMTSEAHHDCDNPSRSNGRITGCVCSTPPRGTAVGGDYIRLASFCSHIFKCRWMHMLYCSIALRHPITAHHNAPVWSHGVDDGTRTHTELSFTVQYSYEYCTAWRFDQ